MPLPLLIVVPALAALAGYGVKKGVDAKDLIEEANAIGDAAKRRHDQELRRLKSKVKETNEYLQELGRLKVEVFSSQIKHLVETLRRLKATKSELSGFDLSFSASELKQIESSVAHSLEISAGLGTGLTSGALTAFGAYGTVGLLASASTGTAIASLSGVAASNATLAFLGGGTLAAGGGGIAAGAAVLGGAVAAPAIAIAGFVMASKAERSLTEARRYEANIDKAIGEMSLAISAMRGIDANIAEVAGVIIHLAARYDEVKTDNLRRKAAVAQMLRIGKALKQCLDVNLIAADGLPIKSVPTKVKGFLEL